MRSSAAPWAARGQSNRERAFRSAVFSMRTDYWARTGCGILRSSFGSMMAVGKATVIK